MQADDYDWQGTVVRIEDLIDDGHPTDAIVRIGSAFENLLKILYGRLSLTLPPATIKLVGETLKNHSIEDAGLGTLYGLFRTCKLFERLEQEGSPELARVLRNELPDLTATRNAGVHRSTEASLTEAQLRLLQLKRALEYAGLAPASAPEDEEAPADRGDTITPDRGKRASLAWPLAVIAIAVSIMSAALAWSTYHDRPAPADDKRGQTPSSFPGPAPAPPSQPSSTEPDRGPDRSKIAGDGAGRAGPLPAPTAAEPVHPDASDGVRVAPSFGSNPGKGRSRSSRDPKCTALDVKVAQGQLLSSAEESFRARNCTSR